MISSGHRYALPLKSALGRRLRRKNIKGDFMLIEKNEFLKNSLDGKLVLLTGAGGGIGFEAAKAFLYMGANVIIAEIDSQKGKNAELVLNNNLDKNFVKYYQIDLSDKSQIKRLVKYLMVKYGCPDVVFNNATITKMGAIDEVENSFWDISYAVNLRAPVMFIQEILPSMKIRNSGAFVFVSSSGASPYMGAYEVFKTAQVELSNTLAMELEGSDIYSYTIGPGLVKTETAINAIKNVASQMKMSVDDFYAMNNKHILDVESAGVGFALSVINAKRYHGQEIGSIQVLHDFNLQDNEKSLNVNREIDKDKYTKVKSSMKNILSTYQEQYRGWVSMNIFEKQWVLRDLKKIIGLSAEQTHEKLKNLTDKFDVEGYNLSNNDICTLKLLKCYWEHQLVLLQGYEKNKENLEKNSKIIRSWIFDIEQII